MNISEQMKTTLYKITKTLKENNINYYVGGGIAIGFYSKHRATEDIDIFVNQTNLDKIISLFGEGRMIELTYFVNGETIIGDGYTITIDNVEVDFIFVSDEEQFLFQKKNDVGFNIPSKENMIFLKLKSGRAKDDSDIIQIIKSCSPEEIKTIKLFLRKIRNSDMIENFDSLCVIADLEKNQKKTTKAFTEHLIKKYASVR